MILSISFYGISINHLIMEEEKCVLVTICCIISNLANVNRTVTLSSHNISIYSGVFFKAKIRAAKKPTENSFRHFMKNHNYIST